MIEKDHTFNTKKNSLNLVRLVLASMVIVYHAYILGGYAAPRYIVFLGHSLGGWAVICFFCISGYLIAVSRERSSFESFLLKRIARLFPAYIVCNLLVVFLFALMGHALVYGTVRGYFSTAPTPLDYLAQNINLALKIDQFGIGTSLSNMPYAHSWDGALYTLHYELLSYIVIAILFSAVKKFRFAAVAILFIVSSMAQFFEKFVAAHSSSEVPLLMLHLMPFFFGGSLTYFILQKIPLRWQIAIPSFLFVICIFYFTPIRGWNGAALMSPLITYVALWFSSTFSFGRLGDITRRNDISYGVYIYGFPVQQLLIIIIKTNGIDISASGYIAITFVVVAVFAILSWITVEKKVMDMLKKGSSSAVK